MPAKATNTNKRGDHEGCIRKRSDGRWEGIYVAYYKPDRSPVRRSIYGKSRTEVASQMRQTLRQIEQDEYVPPMKITVGEWMNEWLRVYCLSWVFTYDQWGMHPPRFRFNRPPPLQTPAFSL